MAAPPSASDHVHVLDAARYPTATLARPRLRIRTPALALRVAGSTAVVAGAFLVAALVGATPPFEGRAPSPYGETAVLRAIPFDAPLPYDMSLVAAGRGPDLAYRAQWTSSRPPDEVAAQFFDHLAGSPKWRLTQTPPAPGEFTTTLARVGADGYMTHFARVVIAGEGAQTVITFDFTPVPSSLAP
jgi:hypothetical protein